MTQNGYTYSTSTFDDLFIKSFKESFLDEIDSDDSEEREEQALIDIDLEEVKETPGQLSKKSSVK